MKKRILAIVLSIVMVLGAMSFSAFADATQAPTSTGIKLFTVPETSVEHTIRTENGDNFIVFDGNTFVDDAGDPKTTSKSVSSVPVDASADLTNLKTKDAYIAVRIKINDNSAAYDHFTSFFKIYFDTSEAKKSAFIVSNDTNRKTDTNPELYPSKWLDLADGSLMNTFVLNNNGANDGYHFVGDVDGWLFMNVPSTRNPARITEEYLKNYFSGLKFEFVYYNGDSKSTQLSSWEDKEFLLGDAYIVNDIKAFQTAKVAENEIVKYAPNSTDDGAYYAVRIPGFSSTMYGTHGAATGKYWGSVAHASVAGVSNVKRSSHHISTLTNGDRAVALTINTGSTYKEDGKSNGPDVPFTHGGGSITLTYTYEREWGTEEGGSYNTSKPGIPSDVNVANMKAVAFRIATKDAAGHPDEAINFSLELRKGLSRNITKGKMAAGQVTYFDANTGKASQLTVKQDGSIDAVNLDGYIIVPLTSFTNEFFSGDVQESFGGSYNANHRDAEDIPSQLGCPSEALGFYMNSGFANGKTLYIGDTYFLTDITKFQQYHCAHKNNMTAGTTVTPTCQQEGYTPYTCDDCGMVKNMDLKPKVNCEYTVYVPAQQATCTEYGFDSAYKCKWCGEIDPTSMVNPKGPTAHNSDLYCEEVPSTCKVKGTTEGYRCSICQEPRIGCEEIPLREHSSLQKEEKVVFDEIPATCKSTGTAAGYKCPWCEEVLEGCEEIPIAPHNKVDEVPEVPATCQKEGVSVGYKCSWCGELQEGCTPTEKIAHDKKINVPKVPASCKASGTTEGKKCSMCGEVQDCNEIAKLEHNFSKIGTVAPTIDEEGYDLYKCADCNYEEPRNFVDMLSEGGDADDDEQQDNDDDQNGSQVGEGENEGNIDDSQGNNGGEGSEGSSPITGESVIFLIVMIVLCLGAAVVLFVTKKRTTK